MKKLLLYLMALLAFGAVPVDALAAKGDYLVIQPVDKEFKISTTEDNAFMGNSASLEQVVIGDSDFALGVYNITDDKVIWYRVASEENSVFSPEDVTDLEEIATTQGADPPANWKTLYAVNKIENANPGDAFDVLFDAKRSRVTFSVDYSLIEVFYKAGGVSNWAEQKKNLSPNGLAQFEINTGDSDLFNLWFYNNGSTSVYGTSGGLDVNFGDKASVTVKVDKFSVPGGSSFSIDNQIRGLKKNTGYRVSLNYLTHQITLTEMPPTIYVVGDPTGGWPAAGTNLANEGKVALKEYEVEGKGIVYQNKVYITQNHWFSFHLGTTYNRANRYDYHPSGNTDANGNISGVSNGVTKEYDLILSGGSDSFDPKAMQFQGSTQWVLVQIQLDDSNKPCKVWFTGVQSNTPLPGEESGNIAPYYEGSRMTTVYANGTKAHSTYNVNEVNGEWIGVDQGNYGQLDGNQIYDGLGLGYDPFYIRTLSPYGDIEYWALPAGSDDITVGDPVTFQRYDTAEEALASGTKLKDVSTNYQNSRYDVTWNFNTKQATITLNQEWMERPNRMYVYKLSDEDIANEVWKSNMLAIVTDDANASNVLKIELGSEDGLYEKTLTKEEAGAVLGNGTRFVVVGRTGMVYNVNNEGGVPYQFGNDWAEGQKSYRLPLTRANTQEPAVITTDKLSNIETIIRLRANFSEGQYTNDYVLTFTQRDPAPVKFILAKEVQIGTYEYEYQKTDIEILQNEGTETYTVDGISLPKGTKYNFIAVFPNGTEKTYTPKTSLGTNGHNVSDDVADFLTTDNSNWGFYIDTERFNKKAQIDIQWCNGEPKVQIQQDGTKKLVTVYFVDRAKWDEIYCYNYSDIGVAMSKNDNGEDYYPETAHKNDEFPGVNMGDPINNVAIKSRIDMAGAKLYTIDLFVEQHDDGTYAYPKLIFAKPDGTDSYGNPKYKQTANLYLVNGGIYSNADADHSATEYLPRFQYNYWEANPEDIDVMHYPNEFYDLNYNQIYLNVPELYDYVKGGGKVAVSISYKKGGQDFIATGIPGNHTMVVAPGNNKLLRVTLADDVVPNNTTVNIQFWPLGLDSHPNHEYEFEAPYKGHNHSTDPRCTACTYNGHSYTGNHFMCVGTRCPLIFTNVNYKDGNVYQRYVNNDGENQDPVSDLRTVSAPKALYLVIDNETPFDAAINTYDALQKVTGTDLSGSGVTTAYKLTLENSDEPDKISYIVPEVSSSVRFYLLAQNKDNSWTTYSNPASEGSTFCRMLPNNPYEYKQDLSTYYTINATGLSNVKNYEIRVSWSDQYVMAVVNKVDADFRFVELTADGYVARYNYGIMLRAHADTCDETHLSKLYFSYAPGYDDDILAWGTGNGSDNKNTRLGSLSISQPDRRAEYDKYFPEGGKNSEAHLVDRTRLVDDDLTLVGNYIAIVQKSDRTNNTRGIGYIMVKGYTANIFDLHLEQTLSDTQFRRSGLNVPVRIFPTIEGVGLSINNFTINEEVTDKNGVKRTPFKEENGVYYLQLPKEAHKDYVTVNGNVTEIDFRDGLQFQSTGAIESLNGQKLIHVYWSMDPEGAGPEGVRRRAGENNEEPVVLNPNASQLVKDVTKDPNASATDPNENAVDKEFSIYNTPRIGVNDETPKNVYLQLEQNGIKSPVYTVNVARSADIPTEIEEILGADNDVEAVYYNLNGVKVNAERLEPGIYVKVQGTKSEKVYIK